SRRPRRPARSSVDASRVVPSAVLRYATGDDGGDRQTEPRPDDSVVPPCPDPSFVESAPGSGAVQPPRRKTKPQEIGRSHARFHRSSPETNSTPRILELRCAGVPLSKTGLIVMGICQKVLAVIGSYE